MKEPAVISKDDINAVNTLCTNLMLLSTKSSDSKSEVQLLASCQHVVLACDPNLFKKNLFFMCSVLFTIYYVLFLFYVVLLVSID